MMEINQYIGQILDNLEEAIHVVDCDGITVYYNQAAAELDATNVADVIGKHVLQIYPSLTLETSSLMQVLATQSTILNKQQTIVNRFGHTCTLHYSTFPLYCDDVLIGACDLARDITKIKELAEQVMELQAELLEVKTPVQRRSKPQEVGYCARYNFNDIVGNHESIVKLKILGQRVAGTSSPVLVAGETGTGKELFVQAIHNASSRKNGPFVAQNCAAFPVTLLESILFGTIKGSFTGAEDRPGLFELANGGTLFLDEINSMPLELQSKLLRVLQDGNLSRLGDNHLRKVNTRIIACCNVDPEEAVRRKELRVDLYYRLNVVFIKVPPLIERKEDIPALVAHFIKLYNNQLGRSVKGISNEAKQVMQTHSWPGNIRELQHAIEHAMNIAVGDIIELDHLPDALRCSTQASSFSAEPEQQFSAKTLPTYLRSIERENLSQALAQCKGNISQTALFLGIPRQTIQYKLKIYNLLDKAKTPTGENRDK